MSFSLSERKSNQKIKWKKPLNLSRHFVLSLFNVSGSLVFTFHVYGVKKKKAASFCVFEFISPFLTSRWRAVSDWRKKTTTQCLWRQYVLKNRRSSCASQSAVLISDTEIWISVVVRRGVFTSQQPVDDLLLSWYLFFFCFVFLLSEPTVKRATAMHLCLSAAYLSYLFLQCLLSPSYAVRVVGLFIKTGTSLWIVSGFFVFFLIVLLSSFHPRPSVPSSRGALSSSVIRL